MQGPRLLHVPPTCSLIPVFRSSVCIDNNTWMWKSSEKRGRPCIIPHVSDVRWMRGGCTGMGPIVVSAGPEAVHHPVGLVRTLSGWSRLPDNLVGQFFNVVGAHHLCPPNINHVIITGLPRFLLFFHIMYCCQCNRRTGNGVGLGTRLRTSYHHTLTCSP